MIKKTLENVNNILILLVSTIAILITLGDIFNFIIVSLPYNKLIVIMLSLLGFYFVSSYLNSRKIQQHVEHTKSEILRELQRVNSSSGIHVKEFSDGNDLIKYFRARVLSAKKCVYDLSWSENYSSFHFLKESTEAHREFEYAVNQVTDKIIYKEIFIFSEEGRLEKCLNRISQNQPGYCCKYYNNNPIPRIQFAIIDEEEIIWGYPDKDADYVIKNPALVKILCEYFNEVWEKAIPIKNGKKIYNEEVEKIKCI